MKKMMSIAAVMLFVAGSTAFACGSCGCQAKKSDGKKAECSASKDQKSCSAAKDTKKCGTDCKKACCAPKADAAK